MMMCGPFPPVTASFVLPVLRTPLQVFIDQVLWAPIFTVVFFVWLGVTSGMSVGDIAKKIEKDTMKAVMGSWAVWPLAHVINFKFVPTVHRLLYINTIQVFYNVFLSIIGSN